MQVHRVHSGGEVVERVFQRSLEAVRGDRRRIHRPSERLEIFVRPSAVGVAIVLAHHHHALRPDRAIAGNLLTPGLPATTGENGHRHPVKQAVGRVLRGLRIGVSVQPDDAESWVVQTASHADRRVAVPRRDEGRAASGFHLGYALGDCAVVDEVACHLIARHERLVIPRIVSVDPGDFDVKAEPAQATRDHVLAEEDERAASH